MPNIPDPRLDPRPAEDIAVTLVRIETGVGSILEKVNDLRGEVTMHRGQINKLESSEAARTRAEAAVKAVEDARWTPALKFTTIFGSVLTGVAILVGFYVAMKTGAR